MKWNPYSNKEKALRAVKESAYAFFVIGGVLLFYGTLFFARGMTDFGVGAYGEVMFYGIFGFLIYRFKSRAAAFGLMLLSGISISLLVHHMVQFGGAWLTFIFALIIFFVCLRAFVAAIFYHRHVKMEA